MSDKKDKILVVDDNRINQLKLRMHLEEEGYLVDDARDSREALEKLGEDAFDIVLLDLEMAELDGMSMLDVIKKDPELRNIPVIVISSLDDQEGIARCIEMGAEDYLPKNFAPILLKARLNASLQKKKLRDLERRYMEQEVMLHQNEKLALLGKLSAGMAHELNNPSAAVQRGANLLHKNFEQLQQRYLQLGRLYLNDDRIDILMHLNNLARDRAKIQQHLDSITRSDQEEEMESYLSASGVENGWEIAPTLVELGFKTEELAALAEAVGTEHFALAADWLCASATIYTLTAEIDYGAERMSEIVKALKNYTYMDQAPIQNVNIHEGLESTLVILRSKLSEGVTIKRCYAENLPLIEAHGSELNQVWTNLIDNAVDAMQGEGRLTLRTRYQEPWVIVEIEDNGSGIPEEIQEQIFDPFFTTKAPGKGSGLGLDISQNIVVQKHNGEFRVSSEPGRTCFEVRLPLRLEAVRYKNLN